MRATSMTQTEILCRWFEMLQSQTSMAKRRKIEERMGKFTIEMLISIAVWSQPNEDTRKLRSLSQDPSGGLEKGHID